MNNKHAPRKPVLLVIMDGFGINPDSNNNGIALADTPHLDRIFQHYPTTQLNASGKAVGLPDGQMGNSEVGHMTIGCGNILRQDLVRIDDAIADGSFFENPELLNAIKRSRDSGRPLHLVGLCSDGGVHSHLNHLYALLNLCQRHNVKPSVHVITDGRDTPPQSALAQIAGLQDKVIQANGVISTVSGRFYSMDRDKRWQRTIKAWDAMVHANGEHACSAEIAILNAYENDITDEFIEPTVITGGEKIEHNDGVIFFNFRNDRARQLTYMLAGEEFLPFDRGNYQPVVLTCLTEYDPQLHLPIAFPHEFPKSTLAGTVSKAGLNQFHCAETEKYAHVTFFLNGGREQPFAGEDREMIPSPLVETYDQAPEMSAAKLADTVIGAMQEQKYSFIVTNFANGDMVGHTAKPQAVIKAVETLDVEVSRVVDAAVDNGYSVIITADHGNCELMVDPQTGAPHTQHTVFPVPCAVIDDEVEELQPGGLSQIAPTVLSLMGLNIPETMKQPLISKYKQQRDNAA